MSTSALAPQSLDQACGANKTAGAGQAADPWQPIASAPKDGTAILACNARICDGHYNVVYWDEDINAQATAGGYCWWTQEADGNQFGHHTGAWTHWQPLPAAPSLQRQETGE